MKRLSLFLVLTGIAIISSSAVKTPVYSAKNTRAISKSLAFPVAGKRSNIGSFWGADRDGGRRRHQGIDIFAKKGTPVVAISDGVISSKGNTPRGGKVLWLQSSKHPWTAYYAHLDKQFVKEGQYVRKGQVLGTVGKTGNARTTPAHLHFGMYTNRGAINPLPYVKYSPKIVSPKMPGTKKVAVKKIGKNKNVRKRR